MSPVALRIASALLPVLFVGAGACARTPAPIDYGSDGCDFCRMEIADPRYGAQLITSTGKVHAFDSIECLASFAATVPVNRVREVRVSDFANPGTMLRADEARFYRDTRRTGPMGEGMLAVSGAADSAWVAINVHGAPLTWTDVRAMAAAGQLHPTSASGTSEIHASR